MPKRALLTLCAGLLTLMPVLAGQAWADGVPVTAENPAAPVRRMPTASIDPRIRYLAYGENTVYRLDLQMKSVMAIQFSDSEEVESILIGDSASWEVVKLKNGRIVSIKATIPSANTNMTVYTDRRVYTFELHSHAEAASAMPMQAFRTVFTYPPDKKPARAATGLAQSQRVNSGYMVSGEADFRPSWVQDNGRQTSFFLPSSAPRPAIFRVGPKNAEQLINSRTVGNRIVVDGVSDYWVLRIGNEAVCIGRGSAVRGNARVTTDRTSGGSHGK